MKKFTTPVLAAAVLCLSMFPICVIAEELEVSNDSAASVSDETPNSEEAAYPITIHHVYGETVIESKPERIVAVGWENEAASLALGVAPVGVPASNYGMATENNIHPWTDEAFKALGVDAPNVFDDTDSFDYEAINDADPDLILAVNSGITQEEYDILSQVAPVVAYPEKPWQVSWRESALISSEAIGMGGEGKALIKETEDMIAQKAAEYPALKDRNAAFCWISPDDFSTFSVYLPGDSRADYLTDFGLEVPVSVRRLAEETNEFYINVSRENADQLSDVEMIVVYGDASMLEDLQADPLMSQIPAIKNGAVAFIDEASALAGGASPSILSIPYNIDAYLELLGTAAESIQ